MDWLARTLYPRARPYERRSRMQVVYLLTGLVLGATGVLVAVLWFLNQPTHR